MIHCVWIIRKHTSILIPSGGDFPATKNPPCYKDRAHTKQCKKRQGISVFCDICIDLNMMVGGRCREFKEYIDIERLLKKIVSGDLPDPWIRSHRSCCDQLSNMVEILLLLDNSPIRKYSTPKPTNPSILPLLTNPHSQ